MELASTETRFQAVDLQIKEILGNQRIIMNLLKQLAVVADVDEEDKLIDIFPVSAFDDFLKMEDKLKKPSVSLKVVSNNELRKELTLKR